MGENEIENFAYERAKKAVELCDENSKNGWEYVGCLEWHRDHPYELLCEGLSDIECLALPEIAEVVYRNYLIDKIASAYEALIHDSD